MIILISFFYFIGFIIFYSVAHFYSRMLVLRPIYENVICIYLFFFFVWGGDSFLCVYV